MSRHRFQRDIQTHKVLDVIIREVTSVTSFLSTLVTVISNNRAKEGKRKRLNNLLERLGVVRDNSLVCKTNRILTREHYVFFYAGEDLQLSESGSDSD